MHSTVRKRWTLGCGFDLCFSFWNFCRSRKPYSFLLSAIFWETVLELYAYRDPSYDRCDRSWKASDLFYKNTAIAPPAEGDKTGVSTYKYPLLSSSVLSTDIIFDRIFNNLRESGFVSKSKCLFRYRISWSLKVLYYGSIHRQGLTTQISLLEEGSNDSSPFLVTKGVPRTPTTSPRR